MQFALADRIQFEQSQLRDRITRLEARVAALESSSNLLDHPSEQSPEVRVTASERPSAAKSDARPPASNFDARPSCTNSVQHPVEVELDITSGMGLTAGPLRKQ